MKQAGVIALLNDGVGIMVIFCALLLVRTPPIKTCSSLLRHALLQILNKNTFTYDMPIDEQVISINRILSSDRNQ